jgi:hypothetical protein
MPVSAVRLKPGTSAIWSMSGDHLTRRWVTFLVRTEGERKVSRFVTAEINEQTVSEVVFRICWCLSVTIGVHQVLTAVSVTMAASGLLRCVVWKKFSDILEVLAASFSETLVNFYRRTQRNKPEDGHFHTGCCFAQNVEGRIDRGISATCWSYSFLSSRWSAQWTDGIVFLGRFNCILLLCVCPC